MLRLLIYSILLTLLLRALWRFWEGVRQGLGADTRRRSGVPQQGAQMVRDPVCGTYVLPARSITLSVGGRELHFCSVTCRDVYRTQSSTGAGGHVAGRTA